MSIFSATALEGQHVIVTGATGGIGRAVVDVLLAAGAKVTATGRSLQKLQTVLTAHERLNMVAFELDDLATHEAFVAQAIETFGTVTGLVNVAATYGGSRVETLQPEELEQVMHTNWLATAMLTQKVYRTMIPHKKGAIVNISSLSGLRGVHSSSVYVSSKFALVGFTQSLAIEAIEHHIRVNAICPGFVETEMGLDAVKNRAIRNGLSYEAQYEQLMKDIPAGRMIDPVEVANTVAFLLSDATFSIVGESIKISGGTVV